MSKGFLRQRLLGLLAACIVTSVCTNKRVEAAGLFLAPRGVRPLGLAGAWVAGADDAMSLAYNPSGLAWAEGGLILDGVRVWHTSSFTPLRTAGGRESEPTVTGHSLTVPIPNLGGVWGFSRWGGLRVGTLVGTEPPLLQNWPNAREMPETAARYSAGRIDGTALVKVSVGAGWTLVRKLRMGMALNTWVGSFRAQTTLSACDGFICQTAEDPQYDAQAEIRASGVFGYSATLGLGTTLGSRLDLALSVETKTALRHRAHLALVLPKAVLFRGAKLTPPSPVASIRLQLPLVVRAGARVRLGWATSVELAAFYEAWHVHESIDVRIAHAKLENVFGLGTYDVTDVPLIRRLRDTFSLRLGVEKVWVPALGWSLASRLGTMYEPSAVPSRAMTPLAVDLNKILISGGAGISRGALTCDLSLAMVWMETRRISEGIMLQTSVVRPPWSQRSHVGNGVYKGRALLAGGALSYRW